MRASLPSDRWEQILRLLDEVIDLAPEDRAAWLDEACLDRPELRKELDSLLGGKDEASAYFQQLIHAVPAQAHHALHAWTNPYDLSGTVTAQYEVGETLGSGGMGVVYKAYDTTLRRTVALKFLRPLMSQDDRARQRFMAEAQAASALDHPNICTVHEIGETDWGQAFIAMAYYEGETLNRKVERGPLPVEEALNYAAQMARGLVKAHKEGIVHRDIKPANVMVVEPDLADSGNSIIKILDFGLAKMADLHLTQTGTTMGTVAYMSPEQAHGDGVDHRTDLWSLGVVLYEMLTGEKPFKGDHAQGIVHAVLNTRPRPVRQHNPDVPAGLEPIVVRCLAKDPARRYARAADLLADLEVWTGQRTVARLSPARLILVAGLSVLVTLLVLLAIPSTRTALLPGPKKQHVAVLPFINNLGEVPENQALTDGLTQTVTSLLARIEGQNTALWVVPTEELRLKGVVTASDARRMFGVNRVVTGSVQRLGPETHLTLNLIDPDRMRILDTRTVSAQLGPALLQEALEAIEGLLGIGLDAEAMQAVRTRGPTAPDAYAFYLQGLGFLRRYDKPGNLDNAITLFEQAIEEDSLYALAHTGLCQAFWQHYQSTKALAWVDRALQSCDRAVALDDRLAPVHVTLGRIYRERGQPRRAEAELQRALALEPNNTDVYRWLGWVYQIEDKPDLAEKAYQQAIALKPDYWLNYNYLGSFYFYDGRLDDAGRLYEQIIRLTPDNYIGYNNLGIQRLDTGQEEEARQLLERSLALKPNDFAYKNLGRLQYRNGQYAEAARLYEKAYQLKENDDLIWRLLGDAYHWAGDSAKAHAAWQRYIERAEQSLAVNPNDAELLGRLAATYAALGDHSQSQTYIGLLFALPTPDNYTFHFVGRAYEILGQRDLALRYLTRALDDGIPLVRIEGDPWLAGLRQDPRYQAIQSRTLEADAEAAS